MKRLFETLGSYRMMSAMIFIYVVAIAIATFVESYGDTTSARVLIYNSWWFIVLQMAMVANFVLVANRQSLWRQRKFGALMLHYGMVVILVGAITTHLFSSEGVMLVREGGCSHQMLSSESYVTATLVKDGGERVTKEQRVRFGKLTQRPFKIRFEQEGIEVRSTGFASDNSSQKIFTQVQSGTSTPKSVTITGGKYRFDNPVIVPLAGGTQLHLSYGSRVEELPFTVTLRDFVLTRYPGSSSPSSYSSDVVIKDSHGQTRPYNIYMNNIAYVGAYRIYQTSYDPDELGTVLTINHDMLGTVITYLGYLLLAIGLVWSIMHPQSRFSALRRRLSKISLVMALALCPALLQAAEPTMPSYARASVVDEELAREFSHLLVQNPNGRMEPLHTYAQKIVRKITGSSTFMGLTPEQFLLAIVADAPSWGEVSIIEVGNEELVRRVGGGDDEYIAYVDLFDMRGNYKLATEVDRVYALNATDRNAYDKEVLKLDEKANILNSLFHSTMLPLFPIKGDANGHWVSMGDDLSVLGDSRDSMFASQVLPWFISEAVMGNAPSAREAIRMLDTYQRAMADADHLISPKKIKYEILYNRSNVFKRAGLSYLALGAVSLILLLTVLLRGGAESRTVRRVIMVLSALLIAAFAAHTLGIALRWYISGRAPWTNSYESMVYVGWSAMLLGILFMRRSRVSLAISAIMAGAVVMISHLSVMDPQITPLVPVLKSYWLMFHVASITASYGFFGVAALLGLSVMIIYALGGGERLRPRIEELTIINEMAITLGLILLTIGIFLGAIWANESWGRYWGWDPKESWALITMVVYAFVIHARFMPRLRSPFAFNAMSIYAFYTVLMTFFGVNYYLTGMHSYGNVSGIAPMAVLIPTALIVVVTVIGWRRRR
ncbi:MAG: cytochrome c biogenesis protein CcsA [Rikenellaceae bacterium]